jgi:hypothetical protein
MSEVLIVVSLISDSGFFSLTMDGGFAAMTVQVGWSGAIDRLGQGHPGNLDQRVDRSCAATEDSDARQASRCKALNTRIARVPRWHACSTR